MARILESRHFIVSQLRVNERWNLANPRRGLIVLTTHAASRIRTTTPFRAEGLRGGARQVQFGATLTF